jgi:hypothetical protein
MDLEALLTMVLIVTAVIGLALAAMSIGVAFRRPCLRGSCGGAAVHGPDGEALSCADCPNRARGHD